MTKKLRTIFAPVSMLACVCLISILFAQFYGRVQDDPAIVNPRFKYWTIDSTWRIKKPLNWELTLLLGPGDEAFASHDEVDGKLCLGMHAFQDGAKDSHLWATIHVRQNLGGSATRKLFEGTLGMWVYPTFLHERYQESGHPRNVFGVEVNDGTNILWLIFSQQSDEVYQIKGHRIVIINTPLNVWSYREIRIASYYAAACWKIPSEAALILLVGATRDVVSSSVGGWYAGFVQEIKVT